MVELALFRFCLLDCCADKLERRQLSLRPNDSAGKAEKVNNQLSKAEKAHIARVKGLPCGVCDAAGPSEAHHVEQHRQFTVIPLCADCHRGSFNGLHGQKRIWNVLKLTELSVLNDTIRKLLP